MSEGGRAATLAGAPLDAVKLAAAALMLLDHVNTVLLQGGAMWMWRLGRIAFPLFALVLACHLARGADPRRAALTLLLFGIPTQPIFALAFPFGTAEASILFTLAAGAALAGWVAAAPRWRQFTLGAGLLGAVLLPRIAHTGVDFGLAGMLLPAALLLMLTGPRPEGFAWAMLAILALNADTWTPPGESWPEKLVLDALAAGLGGAAVVAAAATLRGRPRFLPRYALHLFYPGHLLALAGLRAAGLGVG
ncbi:TraX family protein [Roseomonas sp. BN140053]|uniref:TraX family protein n=1 Tax=Roseomonas sp. BN140053 TaxID=3391898 RepID=UPI0039E7B6CD